MRVCEAQEEAEAAGLPSPGPVKMRKRERGNNKKNQTDKIAVLEVLLLCQFTSE